MLRTTFQRVDTGVDYPRLTNGGALVNYRTRVIHSFTQSFSNSTYSHRRLSLVIIVAVEGGLAGGRAANGRCF